MAPIFKILKTKLLQKNWHIFCLKNIPATALSYHVYFILNIKIRSFLRKSLKMYKLFSAVSDLS
jgi:hypothetical protein